MACIVILQITQNYLKRKKESDYDRPTEIHWERRLSVAWRVSFYGNRGWEGSALGAGLRGAGGQSGRRQGGETVTGVRTWNWCLGYGEKV